MLRASEQGRVGSWLPWVVAVFAAGMAVGVIVAPGAPPTPPAPPSPGWTSYADVYAAVAPVVVNVGVDAPRARIGSGFAVSDEHVVTARHLIADAEGAIQVRTIDGGAFDARVVGTDARTDLALLEVPRAGFKAAAFGESRGLAIGDTVLAIGNPYGLGHSLAVGVLGSRDRRMAADVTEGGVEFLQLSMPLNPGNSGGPIFDEQGQVVGVLSGTYAQGQAIAFAVPVESLREVLPALMAGARVTNTFLGVRTVATTDGVRVLSVVEGGPASRAGILAGDLIQFIGGEPVTQPSALRAAVDALPVRSHVFVRLLRDGEQVAVDVGLQDRAEQPVVVAGMVLKPHAGSGGEVMMLRAGSRAEQAGLREGDVLLTVDGTPALAPADIGERLAGGEGAVVEILRGSLVINVRIAPAQAD